MITKAEILRALALALKDEYQGLEELRIEMQPPRNGKGWFIRVQPGEVTRVPV